MKIIGGENVITYTQLLQRQSLPLQAKIVFTEQRIREWYESWDGKVYVAFSGGKDSTVLLHLVRSLYPEVVGVFSDTGLEYPEIRDFVKSIPGILWLKPKKTFKEVITKHGYPVISKETARKLHDMQNPTNKNQRTRDIRMGLTGSIVGKIPKKWRFLIDAPFRVSDSCCNSLKKEPFKVYEKKTGNKAFVGTMANESRYRKNAYLRNTCNGFKLKRPMSTPLAIWLETDVWEYIRLYSIPYSTIYDMGYTRTGCMFCMFGVHLEGSPNRFEKMKLTHPKLYKYCMTDLGIAGILDYINERTSSFRLPRKEQGLA